MGLEDVHLKYIELNRADIIKEGDTTSFAVVKPEISTIYNWESQFYEASSYRDQLPEETLKRVINEFDTAINQFLVIVRLRNDDLTTLAQQKTDLINTVKRLYEVLYEIFARDFRGWQIENQGSGLEKKLEEIARQAEEGLVKTVRQAEEGLAQRVRQDEEKLEQRGDEEVVKIVGTRSTQELSKEYERYIKEDSTTLRRITDIKRKKDQTLRDSPGRRMVVKRLKSRIKYRLAFIFASKVLGVMFYGGESYLLLSKRWRFWRSLSYFLLFLLALVYLVHILFAGLPTKDKLLNFFLQKLGFIPLIAILVVGLAFASRNYRINSNLLEEYRHRYAVAKVVQNLLSLPETKDDIGLRARILTASSQVLFEHRASGYMGSDNENAILEKLLLQNGVSVNRANN